MHVDAEQRRKVVEFKNIAVANFSSSNWLELGSLTDRFDLVNDHPRLLRSLSFGDDDYDGCALQVLMAMVEHAPRILARSSATSRRVSAEAVRVCRALLAPDHTSTSSPPSFRCHARRLTANSYRR